MIVECAMKIFTCEHENRIKKKIEFEKEGYPIFLCDECKQKQEKKE